MTLWNWLFGGEEKKESHDECCKHECRQSSCAVDARDTLSCDEEWVTPEEWFTDADGKRVRRKQKKSAGAEILACCADEPDMSPIVESVADVAVAFAAPTPAYEPPPVPAYEAPPAPAYEPPPAAPVYEAPAYTPSYDSSPSYSAPSYDSGSSSYDSGSSSCDSGGGCGGGGGD